MGFSVFGKTVKSAYLTGLSAFCVVIENSQKWAEKVSIFDTIRENGVKFFALYCPSFPAVLTGANRLIADCILCRTDGVSACNLPFVYSPDNKRDREEYDFENPKPPANKKPISASMSSLCSDNSSAARYAAPLLLMRHDIHVCASTIRADHFIYPPPYLFSAFQNPAEPCPHGSVF